MSVETSFSALLIHGTRQIVYWALQPILIAASLYLAHTNASLDTHILFITAAFCIITLFEITIPARPEWRKSAGETAALLVFVFLAGAAYALIETLYEASLFKWMAGLSEAWRLDIWPSQWPKIAQVLLIFSAFEFVNYWYHRASHRWGWLWRLSGHSAHHAFKKLSGLNAVANHPLEGFFLILPRAIVGFLLGGEAVGAAFISLTAVTAILAHSNLHLNSALVGWFFTTNRYHIHHHSQVISESNTNYGCVCIVWDRLFGTFKDADTKDTGIDDVQPDYRAMLLMPFKR
ncbi:sterol desaturase family protein [Alteromonas sp. BL110]|uniref:sterol desaturase family protein n=1 Tax=Alteromonas sp. BL110 TaxID=1714845 RepID=UPI000E502F47|nr:sterol desaturase family protein [Alteromonas sp. BL110]AXT40060.1 sterol desaturase family protein [Alteromonas sp. BL110]RKM79289.1 sterol desaturase family protein [Alteromonas sp. BL110]